MSTTIVRRPCAAVATLRGRALAHRPEEVRLRLDRRRPAGTFGQVEKRAEAADVVGEPHERAAVHDAAGRAVVLAPREPGAHLVRRCGHHLDPEERGERRRCRDLRGQFGVGGLHA